MKLLPHGCKGTLAPWGDNYCTAWLVYHGCLSVLGVVCLWLVGAPVAWVVGGAAPGLLVGLVNWLVDRR